MELDLVSPENLLCGIAQVFATRVKVSETIEEEGQMAARGVEEQGWQRRSRMGSWRPGGQNIREGRRTVADRAGDVEAITSRHSHGGTKGQRTRSREAHTTTAGEDDGAGGGVLAHDLATLGSRGLRQLSDDPMSSRRARRAHGVTRTRRGEGDENSARRRARKQEMACKVVEEDI
ncbi:hypothetical protein OIDMADRAFT_49469 [Oidiodendron maius Zn]|uniref:Uncharacterized protein n=1 Tax=Oidiodendron maius (strain Zn) TaxID=913774 RepID=A0A0C3HCD4_OIDMZ|nr:hypothetical protein OIDMADRAFT_49469 [Oidiodendron maius Zn]